MGESLGIVHYLKVNNYCMTKFFDIHACIGYIYHMVNPPHLN